LTQLGFISFAKLATFTVEGPSRQFCKYKKEKRAGKGDGTGGERGGDSVRERR
jgi:hypothetical protein